MKSLADLLDYGPYVWGAFALCAAALLSELLLLRNRSRRARARVRRDSTSPDAS